MTPEATRAMPGQAAGAGTPETRDAGAQVPVARAGLADAGPGLADPNPRDPNPRDPGTGDRGMGDRGMGDPDPANRGGRTGTVRLGTRGGLLLVGLAVAGLVLDGSAIAQGREGQDQAARVDQSAPDRTAPDPEASDGEASDGEASDGEVPDRGVLDRGVLGQTALGQTALGQTTLDQTAPNRTALGRPIPGPTALEQAALGQYGLGQTVLGPLGGTVRGQIAGSQIAGSQTARDRNAPPRLVFSVSSTLGGDSNRSLRRSDPKASARLDTSVGLAFDSRTRIEQLQLSATGLLRFSKGDDGARTGTLATAGPNAGRGRGRDPATGSGFREPRLRFAYGRDTGNANLSATGSYTRSEVSLTDGALLLPDGTLADRIARDGTTSTTALGLAIQTGVNDPIGFLLSGNATKRSYSDTTDPNVFDTTRRSFSFTTRLTPDALTRIDLGLGYDRRDDTSVAGLVPQVLPGPLGGAPFVPGPPLGTATGNDRTDERASVTVTRALTPILTLDASLGYSRDRSDRSLRGQPDLRRSSGLFGQVGLDLARPNGTASARFATQRDSIGVRHTLSVGRSLETARGGTLGADLGASARPGGGTPKLIGTLRFAEPLPTGSVEARLDRSVQLDSNDQDVTPTRLALSLGHDITDLSRLTFGTDYSRVDAPTTGVVSRRTLRAAYARDLTRDWSLETGYQYRDLKDSNGRARSNSVFVTIGRKITLWP